MSQFLWAWVLPIGLIALLWWFFSQKMRGPGQSVMSFGSSGAKLVADTGTRVTFDDVAGEDEAKYELQEVVTFLKHPERYRSLGAKIPKGVLLVGPPRNGQDVIGASLIEKNGTFASPGPSIDTLYIVRYIVKHV